jgi:hypothetical protein
MLAYNIWRYLKMIAQISIGDDQCDQVDDGAKGLHGIMNNTIRIARLKLLFIAAKVVTDSNIDTVKYSIHDARTPTMMYFLKFLDKARSKIRPWEEDSSWPHHFSLQPV